eukprot:254727-Chlamydomonas_euryale.AAC.5
MVCGAGRAALGLTGGQGSQRYVHTRARGAVQIQSCSAVPTVMPARCTLAQSHSRVQQRRPAWLRPGGRPWRAAPVGTSPEASVGQDSTLGSIHPTGALGCANDT